MVHHTLKNVYQIKKKECLTYTIQYLFLNSLCCQIIHVIINIYQNVLRILRSILNKSYKTKKRKLFIYLEYIKYVFTLTTPLANIQMHIIPVFGYVITKIISSYISF